jgi:hypothetical protein
MNILRVVFKLQNKQKNAPIFLMNFCIFEY